MVWCIWSSLREESVTAMRNYFIVEFLCCPCCLYVFLWCWRCPLAVKGQWQNVGCQWMGSRHLAWLCWSLMFAGFIQNCKFLPSGAAHECRTHPSTVQIRQQICKVALRCKLWPVILVIAFLLSSSFVWWLWQSCWWQPLTWLSEASWDFMRLWKQQL